MSGGERAGEQQVPKGASDRAPRTVTASSDATMWNRAQTHGRRLDGMSSSHGTTSANRPHAISRVAGCRRAAETPVRRAVGDGREQQQARCPPDGARGDPEDTWTQRPSEREPLGTTDDRPEDQSDQRGRDDGLKEEVATRPGGLIDCSTTMGTKIATNTPTSQATAFDAIHGPGRGLEAIPGSGAWNATTRRAVASADGESQPTPPPCWRSSARGSW